MSDEVFMYLHMTLFMIGNVYLIYSKSIRGDSIAEALNEKDKLEAEYESEVAKHKAWEKRIEELKQNIEKENAEMEHLLFLSSVALASIAGGITMGNLSAKESNKSRHDMDEFIKLQKERELHRCMLDVMEINKKQQDELQKKEQSEKKEYDTDTYSYERPRARVKNNPITNVLVYNLIQEFRQYPLTAVERSLYAAEVDNIKEGSRTIGQSIIIDNIRKKYSTEREDDRSNEDMAMMNYNNPGKRPTSYDKKEEEPSMSLYPLPKTEELTLKEKLKQHDTYNGYYPNIKKVDLTQPIKFKKISLVINRYLTIPISEATKDSLMGGDQFHLECLLAVYRIEKGNKYNIPNHIDVNNLRFFYEESRILCVDEDDLNTRVVKVKVQGSTISLPSASTRRDIMESISILYPYVDLTKAYYDSDAHLYDFDSKNLILESKKKLSGKELNNAFKHIYGDAVEAVSESVQVVSSSKFADNIKADVINANAFVAHKYPLRFPNGEDNKKFEWPKEVFAREWFFGIEETEDETKARYKIQEKNMVGWDDF